MRAATRTATPRHLASTLRFEGRAPARAGLIGLLRMHCLLADYRLALKTIDGIDLAKKGLFTRVTACHISTFYYVGWAHLMMRR